MIDLKNITKDYIGFDSPGDRILSGISFGYMGGKVRFRALEDVGFSARSGEILGIIGRNGAGKSTLLKIISGVSRYDSGNMTVRGKVRSILELGVGFNPELSGEENVYYNGLVWGYNTQQIASVMDFVFEFAGLEEFRNTPLKNYSSGMVMRLGFALATATPPEILIVDEALAVGDAGFQQKCLKRFHEFQAKGTTTLIVSHDLSLLTQLCTRILVMEKGRLVFDGNPLEAVQSYMQIIAKLGRSPESGRGKTTGEVMDRSEDGSIGREGKQDTNPTRELDWSWDIFRGTESKPNLLFVGDNLTLQVIFRVYKSIEQLTIGFHFDDSRGVRAFGTNSLQLGEELKDLQPGVEYTVDFQIPLHLGVGKYSLGLSLHEGDSHANNCYYWGEGLYSFELERLGIPKFVGIAYLKTEIKTKSKLV